VQPASASANKNGLPPKRSRPRWHEKPTYLTAMPIAVDVGKPTRKPATAKMR
jgi:hypothetical protein